MSTTVLFYGYSSIGNTVFESQSINFWQFFQLAYQFFGNFFSYDSNHINRLFFLLRSNNHILQQKKR
uniref:Uncharacterized protein n=1 Tax=Helianthus annuus TaxID=4232 RepID=A0A251UVU0_HELAN